MILFFLFTEIQMQLGILYFVKSSTLFGGEDIEN